MDPAVSVLVRVFNAERHLREAVESVLAQTFADFELLAIDDGSTDGSVAMLERYADPRMRIVSQPNGGKIAAAQRGLSEARLLCAGPGRVCEALGITAAHNGMALDEPPFALFARTGEAEVIAGPRIGITKAAEKPWRYGLKGSAFLSKPFRAG